MTTYIQGPRHYCQLLVQGHRYVKHRSNKKSTYWKCHQYDMGACKARCTVSIDNTVALSGDHAHEPEDDVDEHTILVQEVRKLVRHPHANHKRRAAAVPKVESEMFGYVEMNKYVQKHEGNVYSEEYVDEVVEGVYSEEYVDETEVV